MKKPPASAVQGLLFLAGFVEAGSSADIMGMEEEQMRPDERRTWIEVQSAIRWIRSNFDVTPKMGIPDADYISELEGAFARLLRLHEEIVEHTKPDGDMADAPVHGLAKSYLAVPMSREAWARFAGPKPEGQPKVADRPPCACSPGGSKPQQVPQGTPAPEGVVGEPQPGVKS